MKQVIFVLFVIVVIISCKKGQDDLKDIRSSEIILTSSISGFSDAVSNRSSLNSDPFELKDIVITGDSVKITVAYSGGCRKHSFEIIWNETISSTVPPQTGIIIIHNANMDMCEAYITETLAFCISDLTSVVSLDTLCVSILNGCTPADSISSGGWDPSDSTDYDNGDIKITFPEGDLCQVNVTALNVICGAGLWQNLWFALDDSLSAGINNYYFRKYLQPVAIEKSIAGFVPVTGKRYLVGARIKNDHDFSGIPICLAYSGPSVPVLITCIEELK
jgi:hypothetical protein